MPLENSEPKDYTLIIYNKDEIDTMNLDETTRVNEELNNKSNKLEEGAPSGIATLDPEGKVSMVQIPYASLEQSDDVTNNNTIITPERLHYQIGVNTISIDKVGVAEGVAPLGIDNLVPNEFLPPVRIVQTFVVDTLSEMYEIDTAQEGDRCVVTAEADSADNGEYVANIDYPVDENGWDQLPNLNEVASVNGEIGEVVITSIDESAQNKLDIADAVTRLDDIESLDTTQSNLISDNTDAINALTTRADDVDTLNTDQSTAINDNTLAITANTTTHTNYVASRTYDYNNVKDITVTDDMFEEVNRVTTGELDAGIYEITLSMIYTLDSTTTSVYLRYSFDGGDNWIDVRKESKAITDINVTTYTTVDDFAGGVKDIIVEARKEDAGDEFIIVDHTIIYQRKA